MFSLQPGTRIGHYHVLASLGAGGMGEVYRAHDTKLGRDVALKFLRAEFTDDADRLHRFQREARVLASLNHPHIGQIYGLEESEVRSCLVLELVEGESLDERLKRGPIPLEEALKISQQIAEAIEAAHASGILHRDLKPANIKRATNGEVKVLDFGLGKVLEAQADTSNSPTVLSHVTQANVLLGTLAYMAPEQVRGGTADERSDVWCFGCVLYELLTARRAFPGSSLRTRSLRSRKSIRTGSLYRRPLPLTFGGCFAGAFRRIPFAAFSILAMRVLRLRMNSPVRR